MKRTYLVTVEVVVDGSEPRDFERALERLKREGPHLDVTSTGYDGPRDRCGYATDWSGKHDYCFAARSRRVVDVREKP